jgi:hypothetical protein
MGLVLAWAQEHWGERGMLFTDAGSNIAGLLVLGLIAMAIGTIKSKPGRPCAACGYDFAGLPRGSLCPECGVVEAHG